MENRYKIELWIEEIENKIKESNLLKFVFNKNNSLRIVNNNYEEIFSYLVNNKSIRVANLDFVENDFYRVLDEYQNSVQYQNNISLITSLRADEQNIILNNLKKENEEIILKHSICKVYMTFGLLDYYNQDSKHTISSAPLVFLPIEIRYNQKENFYQIKALNAEIYLNDALIGFIRKTKKIDISYPINEDFSIEEYLLYVASKVHMFHWSVNNGSFISTFDLNQYDYLNDLIEHQEQISNHVLIKSIAYYNAEFYNFTNDNGIKLNKKLLSLLPLDNAEYRILKRISNSESLLIRTENLQNKSHLINNIITNYLLNNKKVLVVYDDETHKKEIFSSLNSSLLPYTFDLNEINSNKESLLNHLNQYENNPFNKEIFDPIASQEVLNSYYETKNNFKSLINELRIKHAPFNFSLNECIENYYRLDCPLVDQEIPYMASLDSNEIETYIEQIRNFEDDLKKLKCNYKDHPFYGFNKNTMMREEYTDLKKIVSDLNKEINRLINALNRLHTNYSFPFANNLKQTKAILNILSIITFYREYPEVWFEIKSWGKLKEKLLEIEKSYKEYCKFKEEVLFTYGDKILEIDDDLLIRSYQNKSLSRKETTKYQNFFKLGININLDLIKEVDGKINYLKQLGNHFRDLKDSIDPSFDKYWKDDHYEMDVINKAEESCKIFNNAVKYLMQNKIIFTSKDLLKYKDEEIFTSLSLLRIRIQIIFNRVFDNCSELQNYFDEEIFDFSILKFAEFYNKVNKMMENFISINDYLDFYVSRYKLNKLIPNFANSLLNEKDFNLYEKMFYKRVYYDYARYIINQSKSHKFNQNEVLSSIDIYKINEQNRIKIVDNILKNNYYNNLRLNSSSLLKYEFDYIENEKKRETFRPLSRITFLAHETVYQMIPCIFTPLKSVSKLLKNASYHYDVAIFLLDKSIETKEVLPTLYRANQVVAFDNDYLSNRFVKDYIDKYDTELFLSAMKKSYETVDFSSKTYDVLNLKSNNLNPYFKKYLRNFLERSGFEVASDVVFKNGKIDFLVKQESKSTCTALIVDRLPYYSLESAEATFKQEDILFKGSYSYIRIFPFSFFLNEEKEKEYLINQIVTNTLKEPAKKIKVVERKLTEILFKEYTHPYYIYHNLRDKYTFNRKGLMMEIIKECAPIHEQEILNLFPSDGLGHITSLINEGNIYRKNHFIYLANGNIYFRSYRNKEYPRYVSSIAKEEVFEGIKRIVVNCEGVEIENVIKMILLSLGYKTMNRKIYESVYNLIIQMVHNHQITLSMDKLYSLQEETKEVEEDSKEVMLKRDSI